MFPDIVRGNCHDGGGQSDIDNAQHSILDLRYGCAKNCGEKCKQRKPAKKRITHSVSPGINQIYF
jgi:hypothetical protein